MSDVKDKIQDLIDTSDVVLFMKGTPAAPRCSFSRKAATILSKAIGKGKTGMEQMGLKLKQN